jgi:hypothetical protein
MFPYVLNIGCTGMMLGWIEEEIDPVHKVDSVQRTNAEIEEDPEDDGHRYFTENRSEKNGQTNKQVNDKPCNALI